MNGSRSTKSLRGLQNSLLGLARQILRQSYKLITLSPIFNVSNYVDAYRLKAKFCKDLHELDGRRGFRKLTEFTNQRICHTLDLNPADSVVDVGCGDGCLLDLAKKKGVQTAIGLSGSEEEAHRLRQSGLNVLQAFTSSLPLPDDMATVVICNSVLLLVPRPEIPSSLAEIARIARRGGRIWLGEIPRVPELQGLPRHKSVSAMLRYLLHTHGLRTFLGMCRRLLFAMLRGEPFILNSAPATTFFSDPEDFVKMAADAGLELKRYFPHEDINSRGKVQTTGVRYDYIFVKS
jgi:ubiquinone/menaquinone biosynthesis C-methylase UbiE